VGLAWSRLGEVVADSRAGRRRIGMAATKTGIIGRWDKEKRKNGNLPTASARTSHAR
jgi:hypothetical protein